MAESQRVLSGSITKGSKIASSGSAWDKHRQGVELRTHNQLTTFLAPKIRSNVDLHTLVNDVIYDKNFFNDTFAPEPIGVGPISGSVSGTVAQPHRNIRMDSHARITSAPSHYASVRDFGFRTFFTPDDELKYEDADELLEPVRIVTTHPAAISLPLSMFSLSTVDDLNGVLEPLTIRRVADRTSIEHPYIAHSIWGSTGHEIDDERRSAFVTDYVPIVKDRGTSISPFLDSTDAIGTVELPGFINDEPRSLAPHLDGDDSSHKSAKLSTRPDDVLRLAVEAMSEVGEDMVRRGFVISTRGFEYDNNEEGTDSVAFGGLKK